MKSPRCHVTRQPHSGGSDTFNQGEFQRLTITSVGKAHQTQYTQLARALSPALCEQGRMSDT